MLSVNLLDLLGELQSCDYNQHCSAPMCHCPYQMVEEDIRICLYSLHDSLSVPVKSSLSMEEPLKILKISCH